MEPYRRKQIRRPKRERAGKNSPLFVASYNEIDKNPATITPIVKLNMGLNIELSVALPCFHADKIAWLALESLCRQKNIDFEWELIVCEEEHEQMIGDWSLNEYIERLMNVGCKRIVYLHLDRWVLLAKKWQIIGKHISDTSQAFMLQAADCYSGSKRMKMTYDAVVKEGVDWFDFKRGYFYSFISNRVILYDYDGHTNLCMCMKAEYARTIPSTTMQRGIDYFLQQHCSVKNRNLNIVHSNDLMKDSVDTHGMNSISIYREKFFDSRADIFKKTNKELKSIITDPVLYEKIIESKDYLKSIKQIRVSRSIQFFSKRMKDKYNLIEYDDVNKPAFFMGLYGPEDYQALSKHKGVCVVIWCGSDAMVAHKYIEKYNIKKQNYYHIAIGSFIASDLKELGIPFKQVPISPSDINISPKPTGESIYVYSSKSNPGFYGETLIQEIKNRLNLNVIIAYKDTYSYEELLKVYEKCFIGLRLTAHDGLPNTVLELGLMGRKCIYNGGLPNSIPWGSVDDICENIMKEYNNRHVDNTQVIHRDMRNFIDCASDWLSLDYYIKPINSSVMPKVSVVMNSYNENPTYFREAVLSYINQEGVDVEIIISTVENDPCIKICQEYPVKTIINKSPSIYRQLNNGMLSCTGEWITYASSNDVALHDKLIREVESCLNSNKEVCYSDFHKCDDTLNILSTTKFYEYDYNKHLNGNFVSDCALFSRRLLDKYMPFKEEFGNFAYHDFWLRIAKGEGNIFAYNDSPTWMYRISDKSRHISKRENKELLALEERQKKEMLESQVNISK